jgi:hypothetical protein
MSLVDNRWSLLTAAEVGVEINGRGIVLSGDCGTVTDPLAYGCEIILAHQLRLAARPQIVEQLRPGRRAGAVDDAIELLPQVQPAK